MSDIFEKDKMLFEAITPEIIHLRLPDRKSLAAAMCRIQEYYESPFPEIKGKIFTLGQLRAFGSRKVPGVHTYEGGNFFRPDWSGYNWPSYCLEPFVKGLFDPLTKYEEDFVEALRYKEGSFYVIGTYGAEDPGETLDHEICHALYYVKPEYKRDVDFILNKYRDLLEPIGKMLLDWGYCKEVLDDEIHAYISADYDWLFKEKKDDVKKYGIKIPKEMHEELRLVKKAHFKEEDKDGEQSPARDSDVDESTRVRGEETGSPSNGSGGRS